MNCKSYHGERNATFLSNYIFASFSLLYVSCFLFPFLLSFFSASLILSRGSRYQAADVYVAKVKCACRISTAGTTRILDERGELLLLSSGWPYSRKSREKNTRENAFGGANKCAAVNISACNATYVGQWRKYRKMDRRRDGGIAGLPCCEIDTWCA